MAKDRQMQKRFLKQNHVFRDPMSFISSDFTTAGVTHKTLDFTVTGSFTKLLSQLRITLIVSREYEHLLLAIVSDGRKLHQSYFVLPHPSGIVVDRKKNVMYIAATRNPNQIWEFRPTLQDAYLMPVRVKYFAGKNYFHELAIINHQLYVDAVGKNAIVKVGWENPDEIVWWPKCIENNKHQPDISKNYIQLNSIAAGVSIQDSFFTASGSSKLQVQPGHLNYPVDHTGVLFSGKTREVLVRGLTRPHSARLYKGKVWIDNSGYGEVGYVDSDNVFIPVISLPGWTRGLCLIDNIAFVGVSCVLPKYSIYAPGLKNKRQTCGIYAVNTQSGNVVGSMIWPEGNQVFAIDWMPSDSTKGFMFTEARHTTEEQKQIFYDFQFANK